MNFAPVRENLTLFSPFFYHTYWFYVRHFSTFEWSYRHFGTPYNSSPCISLPNQNLPHPGIPRVSILRSMHCHSSRSLSISSSTQIFYASLLNPHHTLHTLLPRTSKTIPLLIYFTITPLPPTTITFTRTPPDLWTIIPQFLIFEIKVCKHSIKTTLRNSSTKTSRTPPPQVPTMA